jgi:predicted porin
MKKSLLALAVLSAFAGVASAQSSVTLSGLVDAGIIRRGAGPNSAVVNDWTMAPSQSAYSSFTLSGREDLGGGMYAFFALNHRFRIQTGATRGTSNTPAAGSAEETATFWRNTAVGLGGGFGDVRLGRILMPLQDMNGGFDPWATGTVGSIHTGGINATIRAKSAIYYRSPNLSGISVAAAIAAAEGQNDGEAGGGISLAASPGAKFNTTRPIGFNVRYAAGPLNVGVAYDRNAADLKTTGLYASYDFGAFKLWGQFEKGDNCTGLSTTCLTNGVRAGNGVVTTQGRDDVKVYSISGSMPLGAMLLRVGYARVNSDLNNGDGNKFGFGGDYNLSKRTNLYADIAKSTGDRYSLAQKKAAFDIGVTHRF